jgi:hypothetical protein
MENIKSLGGLVNKDIAPELLPADKVYDSQNFRITSNDGSSTLVRENIRGVLNVAEFTGTPCMEAIIFDESLQDILVYEPLYNISFTITTSSSTLTTPEFSLTYTTWDNLINDIAAIINDTTNNLFAPYGITCVAIPSSNRIILYSTGCASVSIASLYSILNPETVANTFPYAVVDSECGVETSSTGYSYDLNNGVIGSNEQWYVIEDDPTITYSTETNDIGTGIYDSSAVLIDNALSRIRLQRGRTGAAALTSLNAQHKFPNYAWNDKIWNLYSQGPYTIDMSYYVAKTTNTQVTIKVCLELGTNVNASDITAAGFTVEPANNIYPYPTVILDTIVIPDGVGSEDTDFLDTASRIITSTFNIPLFGALGIEKSNPRFNFFLLIEGEKPGAGPFTWSYDFYLEHFRVTAPSIELSSYINTSSISIGIDTQKLIGWTYLRDDIFLFTTNGEFDPNDSSTGPFTSVGQIWKFAYDKAGDYTDSLNYNLSLVYSNQLNFTTHRPIANPGMIEARYENEDIQKIYWTDNYNVPRVINVANPIVNTLTPEDLNLQPSLSMDLPTITKVIDGGSLKIGVYQVAYRLKNTNGSETRFSRTSSDIPIIDSTEADANISTYFPLEDINTNGNKSIKVRVENIDTTYDTIEFVTLYYHDINLPPDISIVKEAFVSSSGIVEVTITGGEEPTIPITTNEFIGLNTAIKRCKTLSSRSHMLFLGNLVSGDQDITFDARAYRFPISSSVTNITSSVINDPVYTVDANNSYEMGILGVGTTGAQVPETHDAIQDYNSQAPTDKNNNLYLPNSTILGGQGPNVKYEFFTENVKLDNKLDDNPLPIGAAGPHMTPDTNVTISFDSLDRQFTAEGTSLSNNSSPYVYDTYVGYRRDEMYRFGIVFFDELDNPTYVNWIGDIRMPHIYMPDETTGATSLNGTTKKRAKIDPSLYTSFCSDTTYYDTTNGKSDLYGKPLGLRFTIDFSSVPSKYKKAMIVRTVLKDTDKHITGQGLLLPTFKSDGLPTDADNVFTCNAARGNYGYGYNDIWLDCFTMRSPDFLFKDFEYNQLDSIDVLGVLTKSSFSHLIGILTGNTQVELDKAQMLDTSKRMTGFRTKTYELAEGTSTPSSIKNPTSNNPYPIIFAKDLTLAGNNGIQYSQGNTLVTSGSWGASRVINNCTPKDLTSPGGLALLPYPNDPGYSYGNKSVFIQLPLAAAYNWSVTEDYFTQDGWDNATDYEFNFYVTNYKKNIPISFGGVDYFSRSNSTYVSCNNLIDISNKTNPITTKVFGGDTSIAVMDTVLQFWDRAEMCAGGGVMHGIFHEVYYPVETNVAVDYRRDYFTANATRARGNGSNVSVPNRVNVLSAPSNVCASEGWSDRIESTEYFNVDPVFNHIDKDIYNYFPKPALTTSSQTFDCRVIKSQVKTNGELVESWSVFRPADFIDVESAYGPLNNLIVFQDKLFYFQDRGFGVLQINEQKLLSDSDGNADLVLGNSGALERYDYISTKTGTKHQFSMNVSDNSILWFDTLARKMYRYNPKALMPVSDIKGYNAYLYNKTGGSLQTNDNPYLFKGIHSTYDFRHNEFYMTFLNNAEGFTDTLVYNDIYDGFVGSYTHYPKVYINDKINIFSPWLESGETLDTLFIHNYGDYGKFYSEFLYPSTLSFVINENPTVEKVFTNQRFNVAGYKENQITNNYPGFSEIVNNDFFTTLRYFNSFQNTGLTSPTSIARKHKSMWNVKIPTDRVIDVNVNIFDPSNLSVLRPSFTRRLKDKWLMTECNYDNALNNRFVVTSVNTIYTPNSI